MTALASWTVVYSLVAGTVLFPWWILAFSTRACEAVSRWFVVWSLASAVVGVYSWIWVEGCRRNWWPVVAAAIRDSLPS